MSRRNRQYGHGWEVFLANLLSRTLDLDVRTTRELGATYGADLATVTAYDTHDRPVTHTPDVLGWSIEAKAVRRRSPRTWLTQAEEQKAPGTREVVLWRQKYHAWPDCSAFINDPDAPRGWREIPLGEWVADLTCDTEAA